MVSTYLFRDAQQKKDCLIQALQLSREMFPKNPPRNQREQVDALLYLGMIYLIENTMTRKAIKGPKSGLELSEARSFLKVRENLRRTANKFFDNPTKTTLWLSGLRSS